LFEDGAEVRRTEADMSGELAERRRLRQIGLSFPKTPSGQDWRAEAESAHH
jgi:hypothetical protein